MVDRQWMGRVLHGKCIGEWHVQRDVTWHAAIDSTSIDPDDSFHQVKVFHLIDFPISSFLLSFLVSILLLIRSNVIKFDMNFIAKIKQRYDYQLVFLIFFSFLFFIFLFFLSVSTCRSMHRLRDYLEVSLQRTIMLRIVARWGRDETPRSTNHESRIGIKAARRAMEKQSRRNGTVR